MKKLLLGAVALWLFSFVGVSLAHWSLTNAMNGRYRTAVELGEKHAPLPTSDMRPLSEACAGKLEPGATNSIAAYVAKMDSLPYLEESYWHVDRTLVGISEVFFVALADRFVENLTVDDASLSRSFTENANPVDWARHLKYAAAGTPQFADVRYLIVARYGPLTMPTVTDSGYLPGHGDFGAKVLRFPSGDVVCEGRSSVRMKNSVAASGHGKTEAESNARRLVPFVFTESVTRTPLAEVCAAGGPKLCELTSEWVSPKTPAQH